MIIGFDHAYWLMSPILTWPQISWVSTFLCLSWLLPQPCRKWLILKVQTKCSISVFYSFPKKNSHGEIIWNAGELATARAAASAGTIMVWKTTTAWDTSVITQTLSRCADHLFFMFFQTLSSWSTSSVEEVNSVGPGIRFFQLYVCFLSAWTYKKHCLCWVHQTDLSMYHRLHQVYKDRNIVRQLVKRAEMAGFKAIALTVDTPRLGRREADIKNRC